MERHNPADEFHSLRAELRDVVREMRAQSAVQAEILVELRTLKPRVDRIETHAEAERERVSQRIDALNAFMHRIAGIAALASFVGAPGLCAVVVYLAKH